MKVVIFSFIALLISFGMVTQSYAHTTVEVENYKCFVPVEVQNHSLIRYTLVSVENNKFSNSIGGATIGSFTSLV